jgi:hypothetical protein
MTEAPARQIVADHYRQNPVLFVHAHIVKCGGTTFQGILERNFNHHRREFLRGVIHFHHHYTAEQFRTLFQNCPWLIAYSSHAASLDLPFSASGRRIVAIAFVRDPASRFLSYYHMQHRQRPLALDPVPGIEDMTADDFIEFSLRNRGGEVHVWAGQLWSLTGRFDRSGLDRIEAHIANDELLLFPLERFAECCLLLEHRFPEYFPDCSHVAQNQSGRDSVPHPPERIARILDLTPQHELELHARAHRFLDTALAKIPTPTLERLRIDLARRCDARAKQ